MNFHKNLKFPKKTSHLKVHVRRKEISRTCVNLYTRTAVATLRHKPSSSFIKLDIVNKNGYDILNEIGYLWFATCVCVFLRISIFFLPPPFHLPSSTLLSSLPPFLSPFIHIVSEIIQGYSGSVGVIREHLITSSSGNILSIL